MGRDDDLAEKLCEHVRAWVRRVQPSVSDECDFAELTIRLHAPQWEDDGTPYLEASIEERLTVKDTGGIVPKEPPR